MKMLGRTFLVSLSVTLGLIPAVWGSSAPEMRISVTSASGKVVYKGTTDTSGAFKTPSLAAGHYVVQWNATGSAKGRFDLTVEGGKGTAVAEAVPGSKFSGGGVAMKVEVGPTEGSMNGHVAAAGTASSSSKTSAGAASAASTPVPPDGERKENGIRVKYDKGKKYVWFQPEMSTQGGHWVPADSREGQSVKGTKTLSAPGNEADR
jgi:hypothetical protein